MGLWSRRREIESMRLRIEDLEGRLCPCGHTWELVDKKRVHRGKWVEDVPTYRCTWCGKEKVGWE